MSPCRADRSTWWARAAAVAPARERLGAALVGAETPATGSGLVDRPSDERVPEAEASRDIGRANEIEPQELVDRVHRRSLGGRRRGRRQHGSEDRPPLPPFEHEACPRQQCQLLAQRGGDRGRNADVGQRDV